MTDFEFDRVEIEEAARKLKLPRPKNLGDVIYTYRHRRDLPQRIRKTAPSKTPHWIIPGAGSGKYRFVTSRVSQFVPNPAMDFIKIPDATPGIIKKYALSDEQALLAILRYNRLLDVFAGIACYSLQSHLRTQLTSGVQLETDEIYIGIARSGAHCVIPVQAKGGNDRMGVIQIFQDLEMCAEKYPNLICRPIGAQFMADDEIALFEFAERRHRAVIVTEQHYQLVAPDQLSDMELAEYKKRVALSGASL